MAKLGIHRSRDAVQVDALPKISSNYSTQNSVNSWTQLHVKPEELRQSGIEVIGAVPWGTHFCQFYATSQDLVEILIPYFQAGLAANEYCMWITSLPLQVEQALAALRAAVPDLDRFLVNKQIEVMDYGEWYTLGGCFDADRVLQGWTDRLAQARERGFTGLRLTGNTFWLEDAIWEDFTRYEAKINDVIGEQRMIALCTYSLEKCGAREIMDVVVNHQFALIKSSGRWEIIESAAHKKMEQALRDSEARFRNLFEGMTEGFGLHEIICDPDGVPCDYRFLEVNSAFERLTGLEREKVVGKTFNQILRGDDPRWIEQYGRVALTGEPVHFENYSPVLGRCYDVFAYCPAPRQFAVIFIDITERKAAEEEAHRRNVQIELQQRLLQQREQERLQIARDLHDGPVQDLTAAMFALQNLISDPPTEGITQALEDISHSLQDQIDALRDYAGVLRPPSLSRFGLAKAILSHLEGFQEKHREIQTRFDPGDMTEQPPDNVNLALYRIYQESLINITKHAQATEVTIRLRFDADQVILEIQDNGQGFQPPEDWLELARTGHLGLVGIRERAEAIGGSAEISSQIGRGTVIRVTVPLHQAPSFPSGPA